MIYKQTTTDNKLSLLIYRNREHFKAIQIPQEKNGFGRNFIEELSALITPQEFIYEHHWKPRQIAIWDNRCLLHRATAYDTKKEKRVMRRCTINGDQPYGR